MLRFGSGSYNVRESEIVRHERRDTSSFRTIICTVHFLDDTREDFELDYRTIGQQLSDKVFRHLELIEKDYFALQYDDLLAKNDCLCWLDPTQSIRKQLRCPPYVLYLRVKFYVSDPCKLHEEYTRYHFYLQLRKDITDGKLFCTESSSALLGSYAVQSEYGDYVDEEHGETYLDGLQFAPNQTTSLVRKIADLHKLHRGQTPADAEYNFLDHARRLDTYGVNLFQAQDSNFSDVCLGAACYGLAVFQKTQRTHAYCWSKILEISFKRKQFFLKLNASLTSEDKSSDTLIVSYKLSSTHACKCLWKSCVEHHTFFRLVAPPPTPPVKGLFGLGSRFRYSGRTEYQTLEEMKRRAKIERTFHRAYSKTSFSRSSVNCPPISSTVLRYSNLIAPPTTSDGGGVGGSPVSLEVGRSPPASVSTAAAVGQRRTSSSSTNGGSAPVSRRLTNGHATSSTLNHQPPSTSNGNAKETTFGVTNGIADVNDEWDDRYLNIARHRMVEPSGSPRFRSSSAAPKYAKRLTNGASQHLDDNLVTIRIKPDAQGRFGFNVKGGADLNYPIIVSRIVQGSQADQSLPRLNEGDQVLLIQNRDISHLTHDQVVRLIRSFRESSDQDLILTVRPNAYIGEDIVEPDYQSIPQSTRVADYVPRSDLLNQSIILLKDTLKSGTAVEEFEKLYRKKPGSSTTVCLLGKNLDRNRYRDILPYDSTRVVLKDSESSSDYINASFVNMEIQVTGIVNRYIAAQGPLTHTSGDFWTAVWEQNCPTIIMLTALNERGRSKCHQYWPEMNTIVNFNNLIVKSTLENATDYGYCREFTVLDQKTQEERCVSQLQYSLWPDHGVPEDSNQFLEFMINVRRSRAGTVDPLLVHCSAGIGRTGVLILMETAMCLIETNEPVYPLDIVRIMRDQRAMLIQTSSQYRFVCQSICRAYDDGIVKPLAEFQTAIPNKLPNSLPS